MKKLTAILILVTATFASAGQPMMGKEASKEAPHHEQMQQQEKGPSSLPPLIPDEPENKLDKKDIISIEIWKSIIGALGVVAAGVASYFVKRHFDKKK